TRRVAIANFIFLVITVAIMEKTTKKGLNFKVRSMVRTESKNRDEKASSSFVAAEYKFKIIPSKIWRLELVSKGSKASTTIISAKIPPRLKRKIEVILRVL